MAFTRTFIRDLLKDYSGGDKESIIDNIFDEHGKSVNDAKKVDTSKYVSKEDYDALKTEFDTYKNTNKEAIDNYSSVKSDYESLKSNSSKELDDFKLSQFIEKALGDKRVRNNTAMKAILKEKGFEFKLNDKKDNIDIESFNKAFDEAIKDNEYLLESNNAGSKNSYFGQASGFTGKGGNGDMSIDDMTKL